MTSNTRFKNAALGTFTIAAGMLMIEVSLSRLLSVMSWYYLAFFAISVAMLGMTAAAITVYFNPNWFKGPRLSRDLGRFSLAFAWLSPVSVTLLCLVPMSNSGTSVTVMSLVALLGTALFCMVPFYFSGLVVSGILTRSSFPIGRIYAADLIGAAMGCLFALAGLSFLDPVSVIFLASGLGALASHFFLIEDDHSKLLRKAAPFSIAVFVALSIWNGTPDHPIRPVVIKGAIEDFNSFDEVEWNSHSRVTMGPALKGVAQYWGASGNAPAPSPLSETRHLVIDGSAATTMQRMNTINDVSNLFYDVTNFGHYLNRRGLACIIGVGGGRDIQSALAFQYPKVLGVELNAIFVNWLKGPYAKFAGIGHLPNVELVVDEARSYLTQHPDQCTFIQMSLVDTWAATAAGAFSLSENNLYTKEALSIFFNKITIEGFITVSRWYTPSENFETARLLSVAMAMLFDQGIARPSDHLAIVNSKYVATLLVSKQAFSSSDIARMRSVAQNMKYRVTYLPGSQSPDPLLQNILSSPSLEEMKTRLAEQPINLMPTTDENPYFFNMLKLFSGQDTSTLSSSIISGNIRATQYLLNLVLALLIVAIASVLIPVLLKEKKPLRVLFAKQEFRAGISYFVLIGLGFMFVEIALLQKFSSYLGHPTLALAIVLFTIILATGIGSFASERIRLNNSKHMSYPLWIGGIILAAAFLVPIIVGSTAELPRTLRIVITISSLTPVGLLLGLCFPLGLRLTEKRQRASAPWFWMLNGVMGVLGSCLAVLVSIYISISGSFFVAAACYFALVIPVRTLRKQAQGR